MPSLHWEGKQRAACARREEGAGGGRVLHEKIAARIAEGWRVVATVPESARAADGSRQHLENHGPVRKKGPVAEALEAAHAAAQFCHAFAGSRSGFAVRADDAGAFGYFHHADLCARGGRE